MSQNERFPIGVGRPEWGEPAALVVPKAERQDIVSVGIDRGSAIVAFRMPDEPERLMVYYEGNRLGAQNMRTLDDRAMHAYGRMSKSYPTVAKSAMSADWFEAVGSIDADGVLDLNADHPALQAWVQHDPQLLANADRRVLRHRP